METTAAAHEKEHAPSLHTTTAQGPASLVRKKPAPCATPLKRPLDAKSSPPITGKKKSGCGAPVVCIHFPATRDAQYSQQRARRSEDGDTPLRIQTQKLRSQFTIIPSPPCVTMTNNHHPCTPDPPRSPPNLILGMHVKRRKGRRYHGDTVYELQGPFEPASSGYGGDTGEPDTARDFLSSTTETQELMKRYCAGSEYTKYTKRETSGSV